MSDVQGIVYKARANDLLPSPALDDEPATVDDNEPEFTDGQMDVIARVLAELQKETQAMIDAAINPLRERVARLEGIIEALTLMSGNGNGKTIEASETSTIRKLHVSR